MAVLLTRLPQIVEMLLSSRRLLNVGLEFTETRKVKATNADLTRAYRLRMSKWPVRLMLGSILSTERDSIRWFQENALVEWKRFLSVPRRTID